MDYQSLFDRILNVVDDRAYVVHARLASPSQREALGAVGQLLETEGPNPARALAARLHERGQLDRIGFHNALHVIAAHPRVKDYDEAARQVALQEMAAMDLGGPNMVDHLASVDRHRGVLAFLKGRYEIALEYFSRAFERQRAAGNLANVLATLLRLGDEAEARDLLDQVRRSFPIALITELDDFVARDPDLALLRDDEEPT